MHRLVKEASRHRVDTWLKDIISGVLETSQSLKVDRGELWELLDSLPVAVLISTDRACTRIVGNKAAQSLLQVPHGNNFSQSAPQDELPPFKVFSEGREVDPDDLPMQRAARLGVQVERSECEIRFATGGSIFIAGHCIPLQDEKGEVCGSLGGFVDFTEQRIALEKSDLLAKEMVPALSTSLSNALRWRSLTSWPRRWCTG